jgi:hypothetical protein
VRVTSINLTGSQNPIDIPGTGSVTPPIFLGHRQTGELGLGVSSLPPLYIATLPIVMGNIQLQQISVIGLTNCPTHGAALAILAFTLKIASSKKIFMILTFSFKLGIMPFERRLKIWLKR